MLRDCAAIYEYSSRCEGHVLLRKVKLKGPSQEGEKLYRLVVLFVLHHRHSYYFPAVEIWSQEQSAFRRTELNLQCLI